MHHDRVGKVLTGPVADQVAQAVALLAERGALTPSDRADVGSPATGGVPATGRTTLTTDRVIAVVVEPDRPRVAAELLGAAARLAGAAGARVHALAFAGEDAAALGALGAEEVTLFTGIPIAENVATAAAEWSRERRVWLGMGPSTAFGREVLARLAAALGAGLVGDAIGIDLVDGELVAAKPAFSGALVADITCTSETALVSVRPGVLPVPPPRGHAPVVTEHALTPCSRVRPVSQQRNDDVEVLARAEVVIGIGAAVPPAEYPELAPLAAVLGAELAATRKVTDQGWAPRSRQVGITGRSIAPRLYVAVGLSGKFNHIVGVRAAGTILAVNHDPDALIFGHCDIGLVGDWHDVVPALAAALPHNP
jgi:electron transfer flavoprotein alpha subunit